MGDVLPVGESGGSGGPIIGGGEAKMTVDESAAGEKARGLAW